ncbi:patatin-like protein [Novosphingobium mangrovi (ex Hu et al. 2023)]|uniref:Patatin-like protein n=1 Tax=Novosphingobium mangrovi (ex Hu et al. 2023) TaxID=2930094 RepID=A0ABT0A9N4_9SPHN|nr:patatin-like protein [Novosphingobium mangrovi (ex Hu et al. 2023)]MCJ1959864.1 patatin-like protein [Novosphingobium mangrovi (ex Hu et al. 2023)]
MRQKELRIALVCYGGVSLAVYMHGVTKELWHALRASRSFWSDDPSDLGTGAVYRQLLERIEDASRLKLRVMADVIAGASAGGINSVFLAQAIHSGQSLEPLTNLWLECADIDRLLHPDARPLSAATKFWAQPLVAFLLKRPDGAIASSVAPETRAEVREKLSRLIRSRWFEAPFSGEGLSNTLASALEAMARAPGGAPLLPNGHPLDLFVTATDFKGHLEALKLHSPPLVLESEHRLTIDFHARTPVHRGMPLAPIPELVFAARATSSFPGAFPPLQLAEIDELTREREIEWEGRETFLARIMPEHTRRGDLANVALIDGSVLVNAPFRDAMSVLRTRPAAREVDRRVVYIEPTPDAFGEAARRENKPPGFFPVIFGSLSSIPREQPIRDNLEAIQLDSRETAMLREIIEALRPEIEETVERLFGHTLFLDRPTPARLASWRSKAHKAAQEQSGFAYHSYAQVKLTGVLEKMAERIVESAPGAEHVTLRRVSKHLARYLAETGLDRREALRDGNSPRLIAFFRKFDLSYRTRRLRFLARRVTQEREQDEDVREVDRDQAREAIYTALNLYQEASNCTVRDRDFAQKAPQILADPEAALADLERCWSLHEIDGKVDAILAEALSQMPRVLRRRMLLAYLGFPFYDAATLPMLRGEGLNEFDPVQVDRISPEDCTAIRPEGTPSPLRGTEFYTFGAFFSRAYRENDYLWGRLHGAERMIDLIASAVPREHALGRNEIDAIRREVFLAILDEERDRLQADPSLVDQIRNEVLARL